MSKTKLLLLALMLVCMQFAVLAQNKTGSIKGVVNDNTATTLPGATVEALLNGNRAAASATNANGEFSFSGLPVGNYAFRVSMVGYTVKVFPGYKIVEGMNPNITLSLSQSVVEMEDVVVIGYGTRKRQDVTGAVARADLQAQKQSPNANVVSSLRGTVPGLTIGQTTRAGADPTITVRGRNSISGTTSPLIVVDGLIYRGSLTSINPSDIASVDLLKDASAAAVYGSQASNGVLLITTKSGATGMDNITIDYTGSYSIQQMTRKDMRPASGAQYLQKLGDWYLSESRDPKDMTQMNPGWDPTSKLAGVEAENARNGYEVNWWDLMTNAKPRIQSHNINVSGRAKKIKF